MMHLPPWVRRRAAVAPLDIVAVSHFHNPSTESLDARFCASSPSFCLTIRRLASSWPSPSHWIAMAGSRSPLSSKSSRKTSRLSSLAASITSLKDLNGCPVSGWCVGAPIACLAAVLAQLGIATKDRSSWSISLARSAAVILSSFPHVIP